MNIEDLPDHKTEVIELIREFNLTELTKEGNLQQRIINLIDLAYVRGGIAALKMEANGFKEEK